ncbi:MAG: carbohydrate ABC transporter permease [Actinomycetaceae bacterium]|nr:carbohydrate ABC transporter permease [Actinomycetaceae bacterium]
MSETKNRSQTPKFILFLLGLVCLVQILPFYLGISAAFKDSRDLSSAWSFPLSELTMQNFTIALERGNVGRAVLNSAIVTVLATVLVVVIGALASYPLARRRTKWNNFILVLTLTVMMIPPLSILVPLIRLLKSLGLMNSYMGLVLPLVAFGLPQAIFLYTQSLRGITESLEEAAKIDGAGTLRTFFSIVLPLLKPVTITVVILTGTNVWNEFALSSYIMTTNEMRTLAPAIASFFGAAGSNVNAAIAGSFLGVLPVLVAYLFLQKYFIKGMLAGAVK